MDNNLFFIWDKSEKQQLSKHFSTEEFECKCKLPSCKEQRISKELIDKLQELREELGIPLTVTSGFRCKDHNTAIGAAKASQHILGMAVDIRINDLTRLLEASIKRFKAVGDGRVKGFIHVDVRKTDKPLLWLY
jgi:zinc D-Ala-D-Ala carboxypeptidase